MNTTRAIVSVPGIGTVIADAEARTLTPRNAKTAKRLGNPVGRNVLDRGRYAVARGKAEIAADEVFGRVIAWSWLAYSESDEAE